MRHFRAVNFICIRHILTSTLSVQKIRDFIKFLIIDDLMRESCLKLNSFVKIGE